MNGILILDKPAGITSARAVGAVKRLLPRGTKIGHAGTLDPFATGVLLLLIGRATKFCEKLMGQAKVYDATVKLGAITETDDPESPEQPFEQIQPIEPATITREAVLAAAASFVGEISQRPPIYSALKIKGKRACDRARAGQAVRLEPRIVQVYSIDLLDYNWPLLQLRIECGRGTYIRSIARDLGKSLGVGGYLTQLRRTRIGDFDIQDAATLPQLSADNLASHLRPA